MQFSFFVIRLVFLAFPGIFACFIYRKLKGRPNLKDWEDLLEIALFSFFSYLIYWLGLRTLIAVGLVSPDRSVAAAEYLASGLATLRWSEIIIASGIGVILAYLASAAYRFQLLNWLGRVLKVTWRYGDEDIWSSFNAIPGNDGVVVRDHKLDLTYYRRIRSFSDSEKERELHLSEVKVYSNTTGTLLYQVQAMYICRQRFDLTIEVPVFENLNSIEAGARSRKELLNGK